MSIELHPGREISRLPVFPLPETVLFPGVLLPLHIFEPRYRELVRDVLADDRLLAVALLDPEGDSGRPGVPAVHTIAGLGRVVKEQRTPDGRWHVLVEGLYRVRLLQELPETAPYRCFRAVVLADLVPNRPAPTFDRDVATLHQLFLGAVSHIPQLEEKAAAVASAASTPGELADRVAAVFPLPAEDRQRVMDLEHVQARVAALLEMLVERVDMETTPASTPESEPSAEDELDPTGDDGEDDN